MTALEELLGDPWNPANPAGFAAVLAADEQGELLTAGESILDEVRLGDQFVPASLGGAFVGVDGLVQAMRAVFRRDPSLGIGYGVTSFIAAVPVWTAGDAGQRKWLAGQLLGGERAAAAFTELAHGADFSRMSMRAETRGDSLVMTGAKQLINNIGRARAVTLFARTWAEPGSRSHSMLLVDLAGVRDYRILPRHHTSGLRATPLAGVEFNGSRVPLDAMLGAPGSGLETALRAFQVTRIALPAIAIGALDTQLRLALSFAGERVLYGRPVADIPVARDCLVGVFADLLVCDAFSAVAARALHLLPEQTSVLAAACKYVVCALLDSASYDLFTVLGARSYLREGPYGVFQKYFRDLAVAALAHSSSAACLATIIPQLPRLARRSWLRADPGPEELFSLGSPLPELDFDRLVPDAKGRESLSAALSRVQDAELRTFFLGRLAELRTRCQDLPPGERTVTASAGTFALAEEYAFLLAAAACAGVTSGAASVRAGAFSAAWQAVALRRIAGRLGAPARPAGEAGSVMFAELLSRHEGSQTFDVVARQLARHGRRFAAGDR
ncbi:acyl-CoA dehydrogenase family protein [Nonomuraea sp. SBT364]|uniref:acyl-CoA dehydrogenase family protein n=1 Tax=Nonomuraea sp. SBT364 TaxID=1580530 RepID=UPI0007C803B0|nr:acyl-CoA dehydrogenase family protein [Nonomuraea sp. SBT364]